MGKQITFIHYSDLQISRIMEVLETLSLSFNIAEKLLKKLQYVKMSAEQLDYSEKLNKCLNSLDFILAFKVLEIEVLNFSKHFELPDNQDPTFEELTTINSCMYDELDDSEKPTRLESLFTYVKYITASFTFNTQKY